MNEKELEEMTKAQLVEYAGDAGITVDARRRKSDIIAAILDGRVVTNENTDVEEPSQAWEPTGIIKKYIYTPMRPLTLPGRGTVMPGEEYMSLTPMSGQMRLIGYSTTDGREYIPTEE